MTYPEHCPLQNVYDDYSTDIFNCRELTDAHIHVTPRKKITATKTIKKKR